MAAVGWFASVIEDVPGRESLPVAAAPFEDAVLLTLKMSICEAPVSGTITNEPSEVIPPGPGDVPVDTVAGLSAVNAPVAGEYLNCEISLDCVSTTYTKFSSGSMIKDVGPIPFAGNGEPLISCKVPSAAEQMGVTSIQAEKTEMLLDNPEFATNRLSPSEAVQFVLIALPPAHFENATPAGLVPVPIKANGGVVIAPVLVS